MKRRPEAFRATAPFTSLRLRHENRGEALAVGALVAGVAAGSDDTPDVRRQIVAVCWKTGAGTEERDEDTVATFLGSMASVRSESRVKRRVRRRPTKVFPPCIDIWPSPNGVHIGASRKQNRNNVPVSPNCSHMQRCEAIGGGNPRVRPRA